jgi:hypothetical protein
MHLRLRDRLHWRSVQRLRWQLHRVPELRADRVHWCGGLQQPLVLGQRQPGRRMHLHLLDWVHRKRVRCLRRELHWVPDVRSGSVHKRHELQRQRCERLGHRRIWLHVLVRDRLHGRDLQLLCEQLQRLPELRAGYVFEWPLQRAREHCVRHGD